MSVLLVRCDASRRTGNGHLARGLAVVEAAAERGWTCVVCGRVSGEWALAQLAASGATLVEPPAGGGLHDLARALGARAVHVDTYEPVESWRDAPDGVVLSNVDDFGFGSRIADVTVNPNFGADVDAHDGAALLGPRFALVRRAVREAAPARAASRRGGAVDVVVIMGGTDAFDLAPLVLDAVARAAAGVPTNVRVLDAARRLPSGTWTIGGVSVTGIPPAPSIVELVDGADLVVTAAGTTLLELACLRVAAAAVCVTDNQRRGYEAAVASGVVAGLGTTDDGPLVWARGLRTLLRSPEARAALRRGPVVVDGLGPHRLLDAVERLTGATSDRTGGTSEARDGTGGRPPRSATAL